MEQQNRIETLKGSLQERVLVLDGAMGTSIQARNLGPDDFGGPEYEGCNEHLIITRPDSQITPASWTGRPCRFTVLEPSLLDPYLCKLHRDASEHVSPEPYSFQPGEVAKLRRYLPA